MNDQLTDCAAMIHSQSMQHQRCCSLVEGSRECVNNAANSAGKRDRESTAVAVFVSLMMSFSSANQISTCYSLRLNLRPLSNNGQR